jgi:integrase
MSVGTALLDVPSLRRVRPAETNPAVVYLGRLQSPASRRTMRQVLDALASLVTAGVVDDGEAFPWELLRYAHTARIRAVLGERLGLAVDAPGRLAAATANKYLAGLRGVLSEAWRLELMSAEDYHRATDLKDFKRTALPAGRLVEPDEIAAIIAACAADPSPAGERDAALFGMAFAAGLRASELVGLAMADVAIRSGEITVREGKGGKQRITYMNEDAGAAVASWLALRGPRPGPVLCPVGWSGRITVRRLSTQAIYQRFRLREGQAGLEKPLSPHDSRRTWISALLDAGADLAVVQQMAGHESADTTAAYDRRKEQSKRRAAGLLRFPLMPPPQGR